jgi:CrcB protein
MKTLLLYLAVASAGAIGSAFRLFVASVALRLFGTAFPAGTFIINITGSCFLGWFLKVASRTTSISEAARLAIAVGFVGAYTTFSTFMYESNALIEDGLQMRAMVNLFGSLIVGLLAVRLGIWLARG